MNDTKFPTLGVWVQAQHEHYDRLSEDRKKKLIKIGFKIEEDSNKTDGHTSSSRQSRSIASSYHSRRSVQDAGCDKNDVDNESGDVRSEVSSLNSSSKRKHSAGFKMDGNLRRGSSASTSTMHSPLTKKRRRVLTTHSRRSDRL